MNEILKTAVYVGVAAGLASFALWVTPTDASPPLFDDQGEAFFPDFDDPVGTAEKPAVTSLEVIDYDAETAEAKPFKVEFREGSWTIPSHHGYPADAKDRLANTAAGVIGLTKDRIVGDQPESHDELGVLDPLDAAGSLDGRGKRVTLRGPDGVLADFIVGKEAEGTPGMRYVRLPEQNRVYAVKLDVDLSADFADWIETDLLQLSSYDLDRIVLDNYSVDEDTGSIDPGETLELTKPDGDWTLADAAPDEDLDDIVVGKLTSALDELEIVGVRKKPDGISEDLRSEAGIQLERDTLLSLQSKGYFMTRDGDVVSNEGELRARTKKGVEYTLRFGEVLFGVGKAVTAGGGDASEGDEGTQGTENRYLFVTVELDETAFDRPTEPVKPEGLTDEPPEEGDDPMAEERQAYEDAVADYERDLAKYEKDLEAARKKVAELTDRFADWYYVIDAQSFSELRVGRDQLVVTDEEVEDDETMSDDEAGDTDPDDPDPDDIDDGEEDGE